MWWLTLLLIHAASAAAGAKEKSTLPRSSGLLVTSPSRRRDVRFAPSAAFISSRPAADRRNYKCNHELASCNGIMLRQMAVNGVGIDTTTSASGDANVIGDGVDDDRVDRALRFSGVGRLYANKDPTITTDIVLDRLSSATVAVIGLGGVGSWAAESLCRSGVGNLILIDLDDICISNTNRQLHATSSAVGRMKIDEMKSRLLDINPKCNVTLIHDFVTVDNANTILQSLLPELTVCIDAIDGMYEKTALILACVDHGVPIVTCGGAAGRMDPTQIIVDDLTKVQEDRLLFKCRKLMRQKHGFPKVPLPGGKNTKNARVRKWRILAVYSTEVQQKSIAALPSEESSSFRTCDGALGTACFVTGTYGFVAACRVVEMIALDKLVVPKKQGKRAVSSREGFVH